MRIFKHNPFTHKGYSRIYILNSSNYEGDKQTVLETIKEIDEYEYNGYLPSDIIAEFKGTVELTYNHKFDMCMDILTYQCLKKGVLVWCLTSNNEFLNLEIKDDPKN